MVEKWSKEKYNRFSHKNLFHRLCSVSSLSPRDSAVAISASISRQRACPSFSFHYSLLLYIVLFIFLWTNRPRVLWFLRTPEAPQPSGLNWNDGITWRAILSDRSGSRPRKRELLPLLRRTANLATFQGPSSFSNMKRDRVTSHGSSDLLLSCRVDWSAWFSGIRFFTFDYVISCTRTTAMMYSET